MCIILAKKINKIITEKDNIELKRQRNLKIANDRKNTEMRKKHK
jgi:hypothetical protein